MPPRPSSRSRSYLVGLAFVAVSMTLALFLLLLALVLAVVVLFVRRGRVRRGSRRRGAGGSIGRDRGDAREQRRTQAHGNTAGGDELVGLRRECRDLTLRRAAVVRCVARDLPRERGELARVVPRQARLRLSGVAPATGDDHDDARQRECATTLRWDPPRLVNSVKEASFAQTRMGYGGTLPAAPPRQSASGGDSSRRCRGGS